VRDIDVVAAVARGIPAYPVPTKEEFVELLARSGVVRFRDTDYDARSAADLVPAFFFPLESEEDFLAKVHDLLVSRGLEPTAVRATHAPEPAPDLTRAPAATVVAYVTERVAHGPLPPLPDGGWVDAVDYVTHALDLVRPPGALAAWRATVHDGELTATARAALVELVTFVRTAAVEGRWEVASRICDCMGDLVDPTLAPQRVGGLT